MIEGIPAGHFMAYISNTLARLLKKWEAALSPEQFDRAKDEVAKAFLRTKAYLADFKPGRDRAKVAHKLVQAIIEGQKAKNWDSFKTQVKCTAGCSGCCHQQVEINSDEADLLATLVVNGVHIDHDKMNRLASKNFTDLEWWRLPNTERSCLFLAENGTCRVYDNRPLACRKYFVFTDPEKCSEVSETGSITVGVYTVPEAEVYSSAIMTVVRGEGNIPKLLSEAIERRNGD